MSGRRVEPEQTIDGVAAILEGQCDGLREDAPVHDRHLEEAREMSNRQLKLMVRTPREVVVELRVSSIRVPTETGQVGVRPRAEPLVLAVEPGLVLVRREDTLSVCGDCRRPAALRRRHRQSAHSAGRQRRGRRLR